MWTWISQLIDSVGRIRIDYFISLAWSSLKILTRS